MSQNTANDSPFSWGRGPGRANVIPDFVAALEESCFHITLPMEQRRFLFTFSDSVFAEPKSLQKTIRF
jgi:hypothetical protein